MTPTSVVRAKSGPNVEQVVELHGCEGNQCNGDADGSTEELTPQYLQTREAAPRFRWRKRAWVRLALIVIPSIIAGFVIGYVTHPKAGVEARTTEVEMKSLPGLHLDWKDILGSLQQKLTTPVFQKTLRKFDKTARMAGTGEDDELVNEILHQFQQLQMDPWTDDHCVQLQMPDSTLPNRVLFGSADYRPTGYLAYSPPGKVQGKLVYANYGRQEDLDVLQKKNVEMKGRVLLLRSGKISFAEQVDNAARRGASAVLIYPDLQENKYLADTALYGHVHLGSGDPYTPGLPSFNHTQCHPTQSHGLPKIPAQTITAAMATALLQRIGGPESDPTTGFKGGLKSVSYRLGGRENITVEVNNVLVKRKISNVFGVIRGFTEPDRYVILGAQRDAWGSGYTRATVGTSILVELARAVHEMVQKDGFRPRRSLVFASWSAGEYGNVGATEWLEGFMTNIDQSAISYISLDGLVMGRGSFMVSASPLLYSLIESTMKEVKSPLGDGSIYDMVGREKWEADVLKPMTIDDPSYTFLATSGIPSVSFHFISPNVYTYPYYGTRLDNMDHLNYQTSHRTSEMTSVAAQFAGQMALRLVHDHIFSLDVSRYSSVLAKAVGRIYRRVIQLVQSGQLKDVSPSWLSGAQDSFQRAASSISNAIALAGPNDRETCRILNDKIMRVEHTLLSPYVSPTDTPFRHLLLGRGPHTLASIAETTDMEQLRIQLAQATGNLQGCANAMLGDIWEAEEKL